MKKLTTLIGGIAALGISALVYPAYAEPLKIGDEMPKPRGNLLYQITCTINSSFATSTSTGTNSNKLAMRIYDAGDKDGKTKDVVLVDSNSGKVGALYHGYDLFFRGNGTISEIFPLDNNEKLGLRDVLREIISLLPENSPKVAEIFDVLISCRREQIGK